MLRVVVVDDEYLVRERVKRCVDWDEFGFEICGEAGNGQDAIALTEQLLPHIIITDINMPYLSGLDFSVTVRERWPKMKILLLTGYASFEYARAAMQAGVTQYILKPVNKNELLESMLSLKAQIEWDNQMEKYVKQLKNDSRQSRLARRQQIFHDITLCRSVPPEQELRGRFSDAYPALFDSALILALIELHIDKSSRAEECRLWRFAVVNIFEEVCPHIEFVNVNERRIAALLNAEPSDADDETTRLFRVAQRHIATHLNIRTTIGISKANGFDGIARAYRQATHALRQRYVNGAGSVIYYESEQRTPDETEPYSIGTDLLIYMRTGNAGAACNEIRRILSGEKHPLESLYLILSEIVLFVNTFVREKEIDLSGIIEADFTADGLLDQYDDLPELKEGIARTVQQLVMAYSQNHLSGYAGLVVRTKRYIEENYANKDICLDTIAVNIAVNPCYLSSVFKKESGFSIVEYLTSYRMQVAKHLINENGAKLSDVAEAVGFNDPYYFSKCFKKTFGMAPSHYLKSKL